VIQAEASQAQPSESHLAQRCSNAVDGRHTVPRRRPPRMSAQALQRNPASQMASQTAGSPQGAGRARAASPSMGDGDRAGGQPDGSPRAPHPGETQNRGGEEGGRTAS